ncbi:hypothetical protein [Lysobacter xanthus]
MLPVSPTSHLSRSAAFALLLAILAGGCSSDPIGPSAARQAPADSIFTPVLPDGAPRATVTFTRDTGGPPGANGNRWLIYLDGNPLARIGKGETFTVEIPADDHVLGIEPDAPIKILQVVNVSQPFREGKHYYFRALFSSDTGYRLQPTIASGDVR